MKSRTKTVYYCEYCKIYRLRKDSMERHEEGCTLNPDRVCRWHVDVYPIKDLIEKYKGVDFSSKYNDSTFQTDPSPNLEKLESEVDGCPTCMLSVIRIGQHDIYEFDYKEQVEKYNKKRSEEEYYDGRYGYGY
jgi:hypothetical protein